MITEIGLRERVNGLFDQYIMDAFDNVDILLNIGQSFAAMGVAIIALKVFLTEQNRTNIFEYLKWVPLCFLLINYKVFALAIFDFYHNIGVALQSNDVHWDQINEKIALAQQQSVTAFGSSIFNLVSFDFDELETMVMSNLVGVLVLLAQTISIVVFIGVKAISVIYLFVLIIFGPLNIGLSFIPALSGMWKAWLQKFMSVCLWIPMLYLIDNFLLGVMDEVIDNLLSQNNMNSGLVLVGCLLIFMNIFVYLKAPALANFIVQGMDVGASQLVSKPKHYAKKGAQAAMDAKTGGTSKAARTLMQ